jgi:Antibiotic biosynthesis monooxygenase
MWVRVGSFLVKPDQAANLRRTYNEQAIPKVRGTPGNLGCLLLEPNVDGEPFLVMTVWADRPAYQGFKPGLYIVIVASDSAGGEIAKRSAQAAKKVFKDAYMRRTGVYMGCIH